MLPTFRPKPVSTPVARLAREHVAEYELQQRVPIALDAFVRKLAAGGVRPARVLLPFEGHSWEQALTHAVHEHMPGTAVVGWDNVNFSRFALSLYPARSEIGLRPLPDRVVTNGETFAGILRREGFPPDGVRVGCALRHEDLHERPPPARAPASRSVCSPRRASTSHSRPSSSRRRSRRSAATTASI